MGKTRFLSKKMEFSIGEDDVLSGSLGFIEDILNELDIPRKLVMRTVLLAEEVISQLVGNGTDRGRIRVQVRRFLGDASVTIRAEGRECKLLENALITPESVGGMADVEGMEDTDAVQVAIRSILLKSQSDKLKYAYRNGENWVRILTGKTEQNSLALTVAALLLGLFSGVLLRSVFPAGFSAGMSKYLLNPVSTMFMNALQIIIGPVVFFSIVSCISQFKDLSELGRIGAKIMGTYLMTTVVAVVMGIGFSLLLHPGTFGFALSLDAVSDSVSVNADVDTSILSTIVNIVPANIVRPFLEADTLQLIFLAILCGVAVGMIGDYSAVLQNLFEACNSLFLTMTTMIARFIPAAVFCSSALMMMDLGGGSLLEVLALAGTMILALFVMMVFYGLLILIVARLNPLTFFRKNRTGMLTSFTLASSNAAMPTNMRTCTEKLGISPKVCSFSIPLGATVNMDGTCISLAVFGLFLARAYGITVPGSALPPLIITIVLLSLGCPGVPGSTLVCMGVVLNSLGVPMASLGLIMGINPFLDMCVTMSNTTGDVAAALIVAKSEGLLDLDVYNR